MGLAILILGLVVFLATHVFVTMREARAGVIAQLGLNTYRALFAIVSLGGLALIVWGFARLPRARVDPGLVAAGFMRHITVGLMLLAVDPGRGLFHSQPHQGQGSSIRCWPR